MTNMKKLIESIGVVIGGLAVVAIIIVGLGFGGLEWKRFFKPRHQAIERQVFEQTPSFVHGKKQHLSRLRREYDEADTEAGRASLRTLILHEADAVDWNLLGTDLEQFLRSL